MNRKQRLAVWLYNRLDDWAKWEVCNHIKRPTLDAVMAEQDRQAKKLLSNNRKRGIG